MDMILVMSLIRSIEVPAFPRSQLFQKPPSSVQYKNRPFSTFTLISLAMREAAVKLKQQLLLSDNPCCLVFKCIENFIRICIFVLIDYLYCCQGQRSQVTFDSLLFDINAAIWFENIIQEYYE